MPEPEVDLHGQSRGARPAADDATCMPPTAHAPFLNRELSWLEFNRRVLHEALDERTPLLERLRFLCIFSSNLDEFYMKRVGGLKRQVAAGVISRSPDGRTPGEQLTAIRKTVLPMLEQQAICYTDVVHPALARADIHLLQWKELSDAERKQAHEYFMHDVFPVLTPLAVDSGHPFPFISNLSVSLGVRLRHPAGSDPLFARVKVPDSLLQWVRLDNGDTSSGRIVYRFVSLMDLIRDNIQALFPHMVVEQVTPFRLTRNADVERDEEDAEDLLEMIEEEVRRRRFEKVVRLELGPDPDPWMLQFLIEELDLEMADVYEALGPLEYGGLSCITGLNLPTHRHPAWTPVTLAPLADDGKDIFAAIRAGDLLVHHPYESFTTSVERFIHTASDDPKVLAIKMTVYRTGDDSPFLHALVRAAESGKQVVCIVELKARFDEERNVQFAQKLEEAGVHVVYGLVGYKTHTKTALVVRSEPEGLRTYVHIGTGNYHAGTATSYTDLGLFTCKPEFAGEVAQLFNYLTGRSLKKDYEKLLVGPLTMEDRFVEMIEREIDFAKAGGPARIVAKINSFEHRGIGRLLYQASQAGVHIDLIVRGFCLLVPQAPGMSENIHVTSVIGRFLEHSRIFYFANGAHDPVEGQFFIGSADWMYRNLRNRVEAVTVVEDRPLRERLWQVLQIMVNDRRNAWDMRADGSYIHRQPTGKDGQLGTHDQLMQAYTPPPG